MEDKLEENKADVKEEYGECKMQLQETKKDLLLLNEQLSSSSGGHQGISSLLDLLGDVQNILTCAKEGKNVEEDFLNRKAIQLNNLQEEIKESARISQDSLPRLIEEGESSALQNYEVEYSFQGQEISLHTKTEENGSLPNCDLRKNSSENSKQELEARNLKLYFSYKNGNSKLAEGLVSSEDEGLGDEGHRHHSTSPASSPSDEEISPSSSLIKCHEEHKCQDFNKMLYEEINKEKMQYTKKLMELEKKEKEFEEQMKSSQSFISKLQTSILFKEEQVNQLIIENVNLTQGKLQQNSKMEDMTKTLIEEIKELKKRLSAMNNEKIHFKKQISELEAAEQEARTHGQILQERLHVIQDQGSVSRQELNETKQLDTCASNLKNKTEKEMNLQSQLESIIEKYKDQISNLESAQANLQERLLGMEEHIHCCKSNINTNFSEKQNHKNPPTNISGDEPFKLIDEKIKNKIVNLESFQGNLQNHHLDNCNNGSTLNVERSFAKEPTGESSKILQEKCKVHNFKLPELSLQVDHHIEDCIMSGDPEHLNHKSHLMSSQDNVNSNPNFYKTNNCSTLSDISHHNIESSISVLPENQELIKRFNVLEKEDIHLQNQLHHMDEINSCLWRKLNYLETHTGKCKKDIGCLQQCIKEQQHNSNETVDTVDILNRIDPLERNEQQIKNRLVKLEKISTEFEKDLEISENIFQEKQNQRNEWIKTEKIIKSIMESIEEEKLSLEKKVEELESQKNSLQLELNKLELVLTDTKAKHQKQLDELVQKHNKLVLELQQKINDLNAKGMEYKTKIEKLESKSPEKVEQKYISLAQEIEDMKGILFDLKNQIKREEEEMFLMKKDFKMNFNSLKEYQLTEEKKLRSQIDTMASKETEYNNNILYLLQEHKNLETKLNSKEQELQRMQKHFETKIKLLEEEHQIVEEELTRKVYEIEEKASITTKALEAEKQQLELELQSNVEELQNKEQLYKFRISELEDHINLLHDDVENITCDLKSNQEKDLHFGNYYILENLQELQQKEKNLKEKIEELEKNETAYKETLDRADQIVASLERGYKNKIKELELSEQSLREQVLNLEETTASLRKALQHERKMLEGKKSNEKELADAETRELDLKKKLDELRNTQRQMVHKAKEMEKEQKNLETRLHDHDRLMHAMEKLQKDHETLQKELKKLQRSEAALQMSLQEADVMLGEREMTLRQETETMKDENHQLEETIFQLRSQVKELQQQINTERMDIYSSEENVLKALTTREMAIQTEISTPNEEESLAEECGLESKLHLEECMIRAMVALQLELQKKALTEEKSFDENESSDVSTELSITPPGEIRIPEEAPIAELEQELFSDLIQLNSFEEEEFPEDKNDDSEFLV